MLHKLDIHSFIASVHAGLNTQFVPFEDIAPTYEVLNLIKLDTNRIPEIGVRIFNIFFSLDMSPNQLLNSVSSSLKIIFNPELQPRVVEFFNSMFNIYYTDTQTPQSMIVSKSSEYSQDALTGIDMLSLLGDSSIINFCFNNHLSTKIYIPSKQDKFNELYKLFVESNNPVVKSSILFIAFLYKLCYFTGYNI